MTWRLAKSLETLRAQINALSPNRSKISDGTIGDASHASRSSDHNPWVMDGKTGIVTGMDLTHDPSHGIDSEKLAEALLASRDSRIKYVISNKKIASGSAGPKPWKWRLYAGKNAHNHHVHLSVKSDKASYDNTKPWAISIQVSPAQKPKETPVQALTDKATIESVQTQLGTLGYNPGGVDGKIGPLTRGAVLAFRNDHGLPLVDVVDDALLLALASAKPRKMVPERENATASDVASRIPEANAHWWNKWIAAAAGAPALVAGAGDFIAPAKSYIDPMRDMASDVPGYVWLGLVGGVAVSLFLIARRGEAKSVEAFQSGDRR